MTAMSTGSSDHARYARVMPASTRGRRHGSRYHPMGPRMAPEGRSEATREMAPEGRSEATREMAPEGRSEATREMAPEGRSEATREVLPERLDGAAGASTRALMSAPRRRA